MNEIYRAIAWKLINLRQRKNLTQVQLSEKKALNSKLKIKSFEVPPRSVRKIRIEENLHYEIFELYGQLSVKTTNDLVSLNEAQILVIQGTGVLRLVNIQPKSAAILFFSF